MSNVVEKIRLIFVEADRNSNKFWEGILYDNDDVQTTWGRIGKGTQSKMFPSRGSFFLHKKEAEKYKKGYTKLRTVEADTKTAPVSNSNLSALAKAQINMNNPQLERIIDRLVRSNVHKITKATQITYNKNTGLFSTPLGIITRNAIAEARDILVDIKRDHGSETRLKRLVSDYLRLIPHEISHKFNVYNIFPDNDDSIKSEGDILDSLEASYDALSTQPAPKVEVKTSTEQVFDVDFSQIDWNVDPKYKKIADWYESSKKSMHHYDRIRIVNMFAIDIKEMSTNYNFKLGSHMKVFHGTSEANVLSILKSGLKVSPPSSVIIAGKLHGNGIYGAINSSKSLGYTFGRWGNTRGDSGWLFVCDFAMGKIDYPRSYGTNGPKNNYDSIWAKSNLTGLYNDELVVYDSSQVKIRYLLEVK